MEDKYENGCPCQGNCCEFADEMVAPEHECEEGFCEECYGMECVNCGKICYCDL